MRCLIGLRGVCLPVGEPADWMEEFSQAVHQLTECHVTFAAARVMQLQALVLKLKKMFPPSACLSGGTHSCSNAWRV